MKLYPVICALLLLLPTFFLGGCAESGCTDPRAINYNITAKSDDGSCIICEATHTETGNLSRVGTDYNSASPHFNQAVVMIHVRQLTQEFNNSICSSKTCYFEVSMQSLVNQNMSFSSNVSCSGDIYFSSYEVNLILDPQATVITDTVYSNEVSWNPCGYLNLSSLTFSTPSGFVYW